MKKIFTLLLVLLFVINCMGCGQAAYSVQLKQTTDEITSITFVDYQRENVPESVLVIESADEIGDVVADLEKVEVGRYHNDPPASYGYLYIEIRYINGDIEIIGTDMFEYISTDGKIDEGYGGWYYVKLDSMRELFAKYC